ncbi:MAG: hypothetical protein MZW92_69310 [Comamonadaceae bacterium]|nr:hypothetical protein [Comamonadaceae bacterium]
MSENGEPRLAVSFIVRPCTSNPTPASAPPAPAIARFDGRFFVGVTSTRIYCRPVCRARHAAAREPAATSPAPPPPKAPASAPACCCRPELAPGLALVDRLAAAGAGGRAA